MSDKGVTLRILLQCKSRQLYTSPDFADELDKGKVIHEGTWRQDNAQNVMLSLPSHKQNRITNIQKMLRLLGAFWQTISLRFEITKMYLL